MRNRGHLIDFETQEASVWTYKVRLPDLKKGHYGFLTPGLPVPDGVGTIHTFEIR